jgi:acid stress-induced BolA-like protein IbaG/YrbA
MKTQLEIAEILQNNLESTAEISVECPRNDDKHFQITIKSSQFKGLNRIEQNRIVYKILNPLFETNQLHAVTLTLST